MHRITNALYPIVEAATVKLSGGPHAFYETPQRITCLENTAHINKMRVLSNQLCCALLPSCQQKSPLNRVLR